MEMIKAKKENGRILVGVPKVYRRPNGTMDHAYDKQPDEIHFLDGWKIIVNPEIDPETERRGELIEREKDWIYKVVLIPEEEIEAIKLERAEAQRSEKVMQRIEEKIIEEVQALPDSEAIQEQGLFKIWERLPDDYFFKNIGDRYQTLINGELKLVKVKQPHTKQIFHPTETPALFTPVPYPNEIPDWKQPTGAHDAFNIGDKVRHNGFIWESKINANTTVPEVTVFNWWVQLNPA